MSNSALNLNPDDPNNQVTDPPENLTGQGEATFTQADLEAAIQKARQQEKDKLYGKVNGLEERLAEIANREAERVALEEAARREAEDKARVAEEENLSAKELLARREAEWQEQFNQSQRTLEERLAQIAQEREQEQALLAKERQFAELQTYKAQRLEQEKDTVAPQFHDFIGGSTPEEIEQSIAIAKAKSAEVAEQFQAAMQARQAQQRGVSVSGYAPVGPPDFEAGNRQYSAQDIENMSMEEYRKHRQNFIGQGASNNRGLFG